MASPGVGGPSGGPSPEDVAVARQELERLLHELRAEDRDLLAMKFGSRMSARDIGERLSVSEGAVRVRLHVVLARLRRLAGIGG